MQLSRPAIEEIPPADLVRERLGAAELEAILLRRLLRVAELADRYRKLHREVQRLREQEATEAAAPPPSARRKTRSRPQ